MRTIKIVAMWIVSAPVIAAAIVLAWPLAIGMFLLRDDDANGDYIALAGVTALSSELVWLLIVAAIAKSYGI